MAQKIFKKSASRPIADQSAKQLRQYTKELEQARSALMNILEDVKEERAKVEAERDRTLTIIRSFVDGLLLLEQDKITLINPPAKRFFETTEKEVVGKSIAQLAKKKIFKPLAELIKKQGMNFSRKELALGANRLVEVSTAPILRAGRETAKMIIIHDITREQFIEQLKTEFVSIAAHQLRTPISAIKWILRMFTEGDLGKVTKLQKDYLEKAYASNERMIRLINDLLNVTRIEAGKFLHNVKKQDIIEIIEKTIIPFKAAAHRKSIGFEFKKPTGRLLEIYGDAPKIALAFQNLLDNAVRYTDKGRVSVSVDYLADKKGFLIAIKDTGIGIPKTQHKRVFSRFFRASNAIKNETTGTGLGLFIAKNIIEAHFGRVWFESQENKGSAFYFTLPIKTKADFEV